MSLQCFWGSTYLEVDFDVRVNLAWLNLHLFLPCHSRHNLLRRMRRIWTSLSFAYSSSPTGPLSSAAVIRSSLFVPPYPPVPFSASYQAPSLYTYPPDPHQQPQALASVSHPWVFHY